jgi:predicted nucleic acid-binding Zn ribbon protein
MRHTHCLHCGAVLPPAVTKARRYCCDSHRSLAYQKRKAKERLAFTLAAIRELATIASSATTTREAA